MKKIKLPDGREIETEFSFYGGGVLSMSWGEFCAVDEEEMSSPQVHPQGVAKNIKAPKIGDIWAVINLGRAGKVYVPWENIPKGHENKVEKKKIVWIGKYPNDFEYNENIVILEVQKKERNRK